MCNQCSPAFPKDAALHHELHAALHSFIGPEFKESLLWTDIGLITPMNQYEWHAMINCQNSRSGCDVTGRSFCFTGSKRKKDCSFANALVVLEEDANNPDVATSLAQIARTLPPDEHAPVYVAHHEIPGFSWIVHKQAYMPKGVGATAPDTRFENERKQCMPEGFTGVIIPLMLARRSKRGLAGCIIVCGSIRSPLWFLLPRMKATALALLEPKRDIPVLSADALSHPVKHHLIPWLRTYHPLEGLFQDGPSHQNAESSVLRNATHDALGKIYSRHIDAPVQRLFFKELLCWRGVKTEVQQAMQTPVKHAVAPAAIRSASKPTEPFPLAPLAEFLTEIRCAAKRIDGEVLCWPTTCGCIALAGLLNLWRELNPRDSGNDDQGFAIQADTKHRLVRWRFYLTDEYSNLVYRLLHDRDGKVLGSLDGPILSALANVVMGTVAVEDAPTPLARVLERETRQPVVFPQFVPRLGRSSPAELVLVWRLSSKWKTVKNKMGA